MRKKECPKVQKTSPECEKTFLVKIVRKTKSMIVQLKIAVFWGAPGTDCPAFP